MTDFHAQLERQLVDAGRRRASQGRVRRAAAGRTRLVAAAGAVVLALATGGVLVPGMISSGTGPATGGGTAPPPTPAPAPAPLPGAEPAPTRPQPLRGIEVAVLNATTRSGLARTVADLLERRGATIGTVSNAPDQSAAQTTVSYVAGRQAPAREVAAVLGVDDVVPFRGPPSLLQHGRPAVIVTVGSDRLAP